MHTKQPLYLAELYTKDGDIKLCWLWADDAVDALARLRAEFPSFDEVITLNQQVAVCPLAGCIAYVLQS